MNALATLPDGVPTVRPPSAALTAAMGQAMKAYPAGECPLTVPQAQALAGEARARLAMVETALGRTAEPDAIRAWVLMVVVAIGHPRDADTIAAKQAVLAEALATVPRRCLTKASAAKVAMDAGDFFPSLARLMESIGGECAELLRERDALQRVLRIANPPTPKAPVTDDDRAAARRAAEAVAAQATASEAAFRAAEGRLREVGRLASEAVSRMAPGLQRIGAVAARAAVSQEQALLVSLQQIIAKGGPGAAAAKTRAEALRRQMGGGT